MSTRDQQAEELCQKIKEYQEMRIRDEEHRLLKKYGERTQTQELTAQGAAVRITTYIHHGDTFQVVEVNGDCVSVSTLKEENR